MRNRETEAATSYRVEVSGEVPADLADRIAGAHAGAIRGVMEANDWAPRRRPSVVDGHGQDRLGVPDDRKVPAEGCNPSNAN